MQVLLMFGGKFKFFIPFNKTIEQDSTLKIF